MSSVSAVPRAFRAQSGQAEGSRDWNLRANPGFLEQAFAFFVLLLSTGGFLRIISPSKGTIASSTESIPLMQAIWAVVFFMTGLLIIRTRRLSPKMETGGVWLWALVLLAPLSALWSDSPRLSLQRGLALIGTSLFAIYLANRFPTREIIRILSSVMLLIGCLSVIYVMVFPASSINELSGAWQGIFTTKNEFGRAMALTFAIFLVRHGNRLGDALFSLFLMSISIYLTFKANSMTSMVATANLLLSVSVLRILRRLKGSGSVFLIVSGLIAPLVLVWLMESRGQLLWAVGRDPTLTGRTKLWSAVWTMIRERPWLGYGYDAFWRGWDGPSSQVWMAINFQSPHSHNGFLDLWLSLGILGLALGAINLCITGIRLVLLWRSHEDDRDFLLVMFLFIVLFNMTESSFLSRTSIFWILMVLVVVKAKDFSRSISRYENGNVPNGDTARRLNGSFINRQPVAGNAGRKRSAIGRHD